MVELASAFLRGGVPHQTKGPESQATAVAQGYIYNLKIFLENKMTFGSTIRRARLATGISLRELSRRVGLSASYLSRLETDHDLGTKGPTEARCIALATELDLDPDALLALAGRIPSDVTKIIIENPVEWANKIRGNN